MRSLRSDDWLPLAFTPHVINHLLGLFQGVPACSFGICLQQLRNQHWMVGLKPPLTGELQSKKYDLCAVLSLLEHLRILFSCEGRWLDILVAITALLLQD
jgi:hypothetical protein